MFENYLVIIVLSIEIMGFLNAAHAITYARSSQGAIAWAISLVIFPYVTLPLYWIFGQNKFQGRLNAHRTANIQIKTLVRHIDKEIGRFRTHPPETLSILQKLADTLQIYPFMSGNAVELLLNSEQTYPAMLNAIESATQYILIQFYIVRDDGVGNTFKRALIAKAQQGIRVYFIYDEIGCYTLPQRYLDELATAGVQVTEFGSTKRGYRFQINFRNHRKIIVVDGQSAFVGGLNIGDEYLGHLAALGSWRDTHLLIKGPAVQCVQTSFLEDWYWAVRELPQVHLHTKAVTTANMAVLVLPTGPADELPLCTLFFVSVFSLAKKRLWIASPYFAPDDVVVNALQRAALCGVDVRILLPDRTDNLLIQLSSFSYYAELQSVGIKLYRYRGGFIHQKIVLIDDTLTGIGTVNLDNRSFCLNFEITTFVADKAFIKKVERMLIRDFAASYLADLLDYEKRGLWFRVIVGVARLMSPLQ